MELWWEIERAQERMASEEDTHNFGGGGDLKP